VLKLHCLAWAWLFIYQILAESLLIGQAHCHFWIRARALLLRLEATLHGAFK
jgi:hypothetical protein